MEGYYLVHSQYDCNHLISYWTSESLSGFQEVIIVLCGASIALASSSILDLQTVVMQHYMLGIEYTYVNNQNHDSRFVNRADIRKMVHEL